MNRTLRILLAIVMLAGVLAFVSAPPANTAVPATVIVADGSAPVPTCLPTQPGCRPPIQGPEAR